MQSLLTAQMLSEDIQLQDIVIHVVHEPLGFVYSFCRKPRDCNVFYLYNIGRREYSLVNGEQFTLEPDCILYVPQDAKYSFRITDTGDTPYDWGIAIRFRMKKRDGEPVCYGEQPRVLIHDWLNHYFTLFRRIEDTSRSSSDVMLQKSLLYAVLYEILCEIQLTEVDNQPWSVILPAIHLVESDPARDIPIPELARMCGVSETRFRRLWSIYTNGVSPVEYRNRLRINLAEKFIRNGSMTVESAAYQAGFRDLSYFYRLYRRLKNKNPLWQTQAPQSADL